MPLRCVYTDLDGTLLGKDGSLLHDADGNFTLLGARALEACARAGAEVVIKSGRRKETVAANARLLGQTAYIYEIGAGVVIDGEETLLTGDFVPRDGKTIYELIEESGAPRLLFDHFGDQLEYHTPWHLNRDISHLMRGTIEVDEANQLLQENDLGHLRLVDNGAVAPRPNFARRPHAFHLIPAEASKAAAVRFHMRARGYAPDECIAIGDSKEDAEVAQVVGRFFVVANAEDGISGPNISRTEGSNGEGFYEAIIQTLAAARAASSLP
jgi:hydroxymethylpyrimidine pyrophosphatase-like HAD family hydrolase